MQSSIQRTTDEVAQNEHTRTVEIDGDQSGAIVRAMVDASIEDAESLVDSIPGISVDNVTYVAPFDEIEVEIR